MLPEITQLEFKQPEPAQPTDLGTSFLYDFQKGEFVLKDGRLVPAEDLAALRVWIEKVLRTEKFRFRIYEQPAGQDEYGVTIEDLIMGNDYPRAFLEAELRREITQALLRHPRIRSLSNWKIIKDNPYLDVEFDVNLKDDITFSQGVRW